MLTKHLPLNQFIAGCLTLAVGAGFFAPSLALHADARTYFSDLSSVDGGSLSGEQVKLQMKAGERSRVSLTFTNRSDFTWTNDGAGYLSLYTHGPKYRKSEFDPASWLSPTQVARIKEAAVAPGQKATVEFELHAPSAEGAYSEVFWLASENAAWIDGGKVELVIDVVSAGVQEETPVETEAQKESAQPNTALVVKAEPVLLSAKELSLKAGQTMALKAIVKNTGTHTWASAGLSNELNLFAAPDWKEGIVSTVDGAVAPGETVVLPITIVAPSYNGLHNVKFDIFADGISSGEGFELPVTVSGGSKTMEELNESDYDQVVELEASIQLIDEPTVRVGLITVDDETDHKVIINSPDGAFSVVSASGALLEEVSAGGEVTAYYANNRYYYNAGNGLKESQEAIRFVPKNEDQVMKIANFDRRATRGSKYADNTFRGTLELRYNTAKGRAWMINELPVELYLRGLAETSNSSPMEYQKTMVTAARSFTYYYLVHPNNARQQEGFDLSSYSTDQVYRGYEWESRNPALTEAVQATAGQVVEYQGQVAITPYFAQSNGQTKDWSSVWWGDRAYAKGVSVPCDSGKTQRGHGVGISATGAICMANEGLTSTEILNHFFTGIEIVRTW